MRRIGFAAQPLPLVAPALEAPRRPLNVFLAFLIALPTIKITTIATTRVTIPATASMAAITRSIYSVYAAVPALTEVA